MRIPPHHKRSPVPAPAPPLAPLPDDPKDKDDKPTKAKAKDNDDNDKPKTRTRTRTTTAASAPATKSPITAPTKSEALAAPRASTSSTAAASSASPSVKSSPSSTKATTTKAKPSSKPKATPSAHSTTTSGAIANATQGVGDQTTRSSSHAVIGVAAAVGAVLCFAVLLWFVRKWFMKKRAIKAGQWRASVHSNIENRHHSYTDVAAASDKDAASLRPLMTEKMAETPRTETFDSPRLPPPAGIPESFRPSSVGSAAFSAAVVIPQSPSIAAMNAIVTSAPAPQSPAGARREAAMVTRTFVPTLADELPVTIGETIFIIEAFDDGWASCTSSAGQCGVVPLECLRSLARKPSNNQQQSSDWRTSQRASSLYGGVRSSGTY